MSHQNVVENVKLLDWWKSQADRLSQETIFVANQLLTARASSAGNERVISSFGIVVQICAIDWELRGLGGWCFCLS